MGYAVSGDQPKFGRADTRAHHIPPVVQGISPCIQSAILAHQSEDDPEDFACGRLPSCVSGYIQHKEKSYAPRARLPISGQVVQWDAGGICQSLVRSTGHHTRRSPRQHLQYLSARRFPLPINVGCRLKHGFVVELKWVGRMSDVLFLATTVLATTDQDEPRRRCCDQKVGTLHTKHAVPLFVPFFDRIDHA